MMIDDHEEEEEESGQNRLFVTLAVALIGLLVLGLLGVGAVFIIRQNMDQQTVALQPTPTLLIKLPNPTATSTPLPKPPTNTPMPTPTNTPVLVPGSAQEAAAGSGKPQAGSTLPALKPAATKAPPTPAAPKNAVVPNTGFGGFEAVLVALGLVGVLFVVRRLRMAL